MAPSKMRTHLKKCISSSSLTPFPTIQQPKITSQIPSSFMIKIWCICRLPKYAFAHMVECEKCDMWFHKPCAGLPDDDSKLVNFPAPFVVRRITLVYLLNDNYSNVVQLISYLSYSI